MIYTTTTTTKKRQQGNDNKETTTRKRQQGNNNNNNNNNNKETTKNNNINKNTIGTTIAAQQGCKLSHILFPNHSHTKEKPYKCKFCDKRFRGGTDKARHERSHTGEKPYKCSYCNRFVYFLHWMAFGSF